MIYAKLEGGKLCVLRGVPNVSNPKPATLAAYAAAHGYKPYQPTPVPEDGGHYHYGYAETEGGIEDVCTPYTAAHRHAKQRAQREAEETANALKEKVADFEDILRVDMPTNEEWEALQIKLNEGLGSMEERVQSRYIHEKIAT